MFFSDADCTSPAKTAIITTNASTGSFFYKDTVIGSLGDYSRSHRLYLNPADGRIHQLALQHGIVQRADQRLLVDDLAAVSRRPNRQPNQPNSGNNYQPEQNIGERQVYSNAGCTTQITTTLISPAIDGGHDTNNFFYKDTTQAPRPLPPQQAQLRRSKRNPW